MWNLVCGGLMYAILEENGQCSAVDFLIARVNVKKADVKKPSRRETRAKLLFARVNVKKPGRREVRANFLIPHVFV